MTTSMTSTLDLDLIASLQDGSPYALDQARAAAKVQQAARELIASGQGWGDRKVLLSRLCAALGTTVARFGGRLVHWQAAGLVSMARCDLPQAVGQVEVDASEVRCGLSSWHFLVVG
jgi:hypothetical protein